MLEKIDTLLQEPLLDDWSRGFLESLRVQVRRRSAQNEEGLDFDLLSDRQKVTLNKIESRFSPQEKAKLEQWADTYKSEYRTRAKVIAKYYSLTSYFHDIAHKILLDEEYIPAMHRCKKMSENKYAEGVWRNWNDEPRFKDGDLVELRKGQNKEKCIGFVLNSEQPVRSHAKGGKSYSILLLGHTKPIIREERYLKKPNKKWSKK